MNLEHKNKKVLSTFKTRMFSTFGILFYFFIVFLLIALSDIKNGWSPISDLTGKKISLGFLIIWVIPLIISACLEVKNVFFKHNFSATFIFLSLMIFCIFSPTLVYIFKFYEYINIINFNFIFIITTVISIFSSSLIIIFYMYLNGLLQIKKIVIQLSLFIFIIGLFISFFYFGLVKGWTTLVLLFTITASTDSFAYIGGMLFGKKKMSPFISPKKTVAGGITGVVSSTIFTSLLLLIFTTINPEHNILANFFGIKINNLENVNNNYASFKFWWISVMFIILILSIISIIGDLTFSYIKRQYKIKDFSNLIPGHGGILDRFDSASCVFLIYIIFTFLIAIFSNSNAFI